MVQSDRRARPPRRGRERRSVTILLASLLACIPAGAAARDFDTGVPDLRLRFDNTLRYNLGFRVEGVDERIGANPAFTGGEYSFGRGDVVTNRLDLLSELDATYRALHGARVSVAAWYDDAYRGATATRSPALASLPGTYLGDEFSEFTRRRYRGPWGEVLDAFVFTRIDALGVPVDVKAGRHTLYWGESLMLGGATHGVSWSQMPLDLQKGFATPGVEAKELFRPLASISAIAHVSPSLSIAAQFFLEWQSFLYPEGGTFLGAADAAFNGPDGIFRPVGGTPSYLENAGAREPREWGEWGVAVRWSPEALDGTLGLYVRHYTDKFAAMLLTPNPGAQGPMSPALDAPLEYRQYYAEGVDLVGLSLAKQILGVSVGAEASYRLDAPLLAQSFGFAAAPAPPLVPVLFPNGAPRLVGNSYQARGDTMHAVLNGVAVLPGTRAFSTASLAVEFTASRWMRVTENRDMFYAEGFGVCRSDPALAAAGLARTERDGCATRGHVGVSAGFTPTWYRAFSGTDLSAPVTASWTIHGNSPVAFGGNEGAGTWSAGVAADIRSRYRLDLRYVDFFGRTTDDGATVTSANGLQGLLHRRGNVTLTAKATF